MNNFKIFNSYMRGRTYLYSVLILAMLIFGIIDSFGIYNKSVNEGNSLKERIAFSYDTDDPDMLKYFLNTNSGDTIVSGHVKADECFKKDDGSDSDKCYASVTKIVEEERTRTETYMCGKDMNQVCTRTVTEWVEISNKTQKTKTVNMLGQSMPYDFVKINNGCGKWNKVKRDFWKSPQRYCYKTVDNEYDAVVGVVIDNNKINSAFTKAKIGTSIDHFKENYVGSNFWAKFWLGFFIILQIIIAVVWIGYIIVKDLADGKDNSF